MPQNTYSLVAYSINIPTLQGGYTFYCVRKVHHIYVIFTRWIVLFEWRSVVLGILLHLSWGGSFSLSRELSALPAGNCWDKYALPTAGLFPATALCLKLLPNEVLTIWLISCSAILARLTMFCKFAKFSPRFVDGAWLVAAARSHHCCRWVSNPWYNTASNSGTCWLIVFWSISAVSLIRVTISLWN